MRRSTVPTLREQKKALRTFVLVARDGLSLAERAAGSAAILARFTALPEVVAARSILCFAAFGSEVATVPLMRWVLASHKVLAVPLVVGPEQMESRRVTDPDRDLSPGHWQIPEPGPGLPALSPQSLDVIVVPGSAFAADGSRIGYGGGFYDAYLGRAPQARRVAVAYDVQILARLPQSGHDLPMDVIVTENRMLRPPRGRAPHTGD
jgi:5-formyltetrahydrofolate cyclo-ligase